MWVFLTTCAFLGSLCQSRSNSSRSSWNISCATKFSAGIGYWGGKFLGTLILLPTVRSRFCSDCLTSSPVNTGNECFPLELRSPTGLWPTERFSHFVTFFSPPLHERTIRPVYWRKSVRHRRRPLYKYRTALSESFATLPNLSTKPDNRYLTTKRKLLAMFNFIRSFKHYLLGR